MMDRDGLFAVFFLLILFLIPVLTFYALFALLQPSGFWENTAWFVLSLCVSILLEFVHTAIARAV